MLLKNSDQLITKFRGVGRANIDSIWNQDLTVDNPK